MKKTDCLTFIVSELMAAGISCRIEDTRGNHVKIIWQVPGKQTRVYFTGASPSDWRAPMRARSDVRRMLRQDGINVQTS